MVTMSGIAGEGVLDVIVRFHDIRRLRNLERCVFSLVGQHYRPLHVHLVVQRFTPEMIDETKSRLSPLLEISGRPEFSIHNWESLEPADARSVLANIGISAARGQYLAFLDYDDALYPEAYELLVAQLRRSGAAIAFGGICVKICDVYAEFDYVKEKQFPFKGSGLIDLFRDNFCPIHSFVVDRSRVPEMHLRFDPALTRAEDYDFLLRICSQFISDFALLSTTIGDYTYRTDGTNSISNQWNRSTSCHQSWVAAAEFLEQRRRITTVSADVQRMLGIEPVGNLSIRELLDGLASARISAETPDPIFKAAAPDLMTRLSWYAGHPRNIPRALNRARFLLQTGGIGGLKANLFARRTARRR
jgi:hypothetical protein